MDPGGAQLDSDSGLEPGQFQGFQTGRSYQTHQKPPVMLNRDSQLMRMSIFPNSFRACSTAAAMARGARTSRDRGRHLWPVAAASFLAA